MTEDGPGLMTRAVETASADETRELGRRVGALVREGDLIALVGDLGSGKTVFAQGLAAGLGSGDVVSSPTFVIVNEYAGRLPIQHVDLYRLGDPAAVESLGYRELFWSDGVTVVEWAERAGDLLPEDRLEIAFSFLEETGRELQLTATGPRSAALLSALCASSERERPCGS